MAQYLRTLLMKTLNNTDKKIQCFTYHTILPHATERFNQKSSNLRVAAHRLRNFLLMVAMHNYYYCILTGASPLQHKDKVPAEGAAH